MFVNASHDALNTGWSRIAGEFLPPGHRVNQQKFAGLVDQLLAEILDEQKQTFMLQHDVGLRLAEVAEILDSNLATTKNR